MKKHPISVVASFVAMLGLAGVVTSTPAFAGGRHGNRNCDPYSTCGVERPGFDGLTHGKPWGEGHILGGAGHRQNCQNPCQTNSYYGIKYIYQQPSQPMYLAPMPMSNSPTLILQPTPAATPTPVPAAPAVAAPTAK